MDREKFDVGWRKSLEAERRHKEQIKIRKRKKSKITLYNENKTIYRRAANVSGLPLYSIYVLLNKGILTPYLAEDLDWILIEHVFPELIKSKVVIKALLARLTKSDRRELCENAGESEVQCYARRCLETNPNLKRKELIVMLESRFTRINWGSKDESGYTVRQRYGAMIRRLRDSIKAKQRYSYSHARLKAAEIEYFLTYLDENIQIIQSNLDNKYIVSKEEENSARSILETLKERTAKGITTLSGFDECFRLCGRKMPYRWAEFLLKLQIDIMALAKKFRNSSREKELIRYSTDLPQMTYDEVYEVKDQLYFFDNIISIGKKLAEIFSEPFYADEDKIKAESLLNNYREMGRQKLSEVELWVFPLIREMRKEKK